jgi:hypothetical protein
MQKLQRKMQIGNKHIRKKFKSLICILYIQFKEKRFKMQNHKEKC